MTSPTTVEQLQGAPTSHGLYEDLGTLEHGRTKLDLGGYRFDPIRKLPLYLFNLINESGDIVGEYHFTPGEAGLVGEIGNAGGHVAEAFRNNGHSQEAIKALGGVASRHGMPSFIITCPKDNVAARKGLDNVGVELITGDGDICFYEIPASKD